MKRLAVLCSTMFLATACSGSDATHDFGGGGDGDTGAGTGTGDADEDGDGEDESGGEEGDGAGPDTKFDVPSPDMPLPDDRPLGCEKVDLLFVIDDSFSMLDEQSQLIASFPNFVESMRAKLDQARGYHVGVTTTDEYVHHDAACRIEGALVTQVGEVTNQGHQTKVCDPYEEGGRYMTEEDDLETRFTCAGKVGNRGSNDERPLRTMERALSEELGLPGACNEGFVRDDALLVVVLITDEEDDDEAMAGTCNSAGCYPGSGDSPADWFDRIVAIKDGFEQHIVMLSLVGVDGPDECPPSGKAGGTGEDGAEIGHRLMQFTEMFTNHHLGPVCADDYGPFFDDAVDIIFQACEAFDPPG